MLGAHLSALRGRLSMFAFCGSIVTTVHFARSCTRGLVRAKYCACAVAVGLACRLLAESAGAASTAWKGTTSADWSNSLNWASGVPNSGLDVIFDQNSIGTLATNNDLTSGTAVQGIVNTSTSNVGPSSNF